MNGNESDEHHIFRTNCFKPFKILKKKVKKNLSAQL